VLLWNTGTSILDGNLTHLIFRSVSGSDTKPAFAVVVAHGVNGIADEVDQYLLNLDAVDGAFAELCFRDHLDGNIGLLKFVGEQGWDIGNEKLRIVMGNLLSTPLTDKAPELLDDVAGSTTLQRDLLHGITQPVGVRSACLK